ncbi:hypothetical protein SDRG_12220 [Saprolegnia diclina VS20]|uniref:Mediator of RNA polymerase II transcription subunit 13 n=1 Tax=Saprolegnia diclina (strain VS20) TaxID=1156394 RepID=T0RCK3_SAPDV|nr:hypothetical protein SDRG_12220 [Saprolegnia diclina VS20]EQC29938.1 hypothetical protein SDRG_12220 [Saprolegnia diclina VS20]|eukprot:XP_008616505.1 hypothetical protein SDRG_12220 [Saprolegnia diclina VS20]
MGDPNKIPLVGTTSVRTTEMRSNAWSLGEVTRLEYRVFGPSGDRGLHARLLTWADSDHRRPLLVSVADDHVWSFTVNFQDTPHVVPSEFDGLETRAGAWTPDIERDDDVLRMFEAAIERQLRAWFLQQARVAWSGALDASGVPAFRAEADYLVSTEPQFTFRTLSANRENTWETHVDADVPTPAFQIQATLSRSNAVWVHVVVFRKALLSTAHGLEYPRMLWKRLQALPCEGFGAESIIDVWTMRDVSVTGVLAATPTPIIVEKDRFRVAKRPRMTKLSSESQASSPERPPPFSPNALDPKRPKLPASQSTSPSQQHTTDDEALTPISPDLGVKHELLCVDFAGVGTDAPLHRSRRVHAFVPSAKTKSKAKVEAKRVVRKKSAWRMLLRVPKDLPKGGNNDESEYYSTADEADSVVPLPLPPRPVAVTDPMLLTLATTVAKEMHTETADTSAKPALLRVAPAYASTSAEDDERRYLPVGTMPYNVPGLAGPSSVKTSVVPPSTVVALPFSTTPRADMTLGLRLLAKDALVGWKLNPSSWIPPAPRGLAASDSAQRQRFLTHSVAAHVDAFAARMLVSPASWLGPDAVCGASTNTLRGRIPDVHVAKAETVLSLPPHLLPEWPLRGFAPLGPMKNVDYVVLCPDAPWLANRTTSHVASVRTAYMNLSLGDHEPLELAGRWSVSTDVIGADLDTAILLLRKSPGDAFHTYTAAASHLTRILADGPTTQAFARTAIATVVYVVAPFGRDEVPLAARLLSAVASGLFPGDVPGDWQAGVVLELLYLPDVLAPPTPLAFADHAFALYDKIYEKVPLQYDTMAVSSGPKPLTSHVNEKLFALATSDHCCDAFLGYALVDSTLVYSLVDANGSLMDVDVQTTSSASLSAEDMAMLLSKALAFYVLSRDTSSKTSRGVLCITKVGAPLASDEAALWSRVWASELAGGLAKYASSVRRCLVSSLVPAPELQMHMLDARGENVQTMLAAGATRGLLVVSPVDVAPGNGTCRVGQDPSLLAVALATDGRADIVLVVTIDATLPSPEADDTGDDGSGEEGEADGVVGPLLRQLQDHTWLSVDPISGRKQSPYPRHAGAVAHMVRLVHGVR